MISWTLTIKGYCEQLFDQNFIRLNGPFFEWYNQDIYKTKRICWQNRLLQNIDKQKWATSLNRHFSKGDTQMHEKWSVTAVISKQAITPHELPHTIRTICSRRQKTRCICESLEKWNSLLLQAEMKTWQSQFGKY